MLKWVTGNDQDSKCQIKYSELEQEQNPIGEVQKSSYVEADR